MASLLGLLEIYSTGDLQMSGFFSFQTPFGRSFSFVSIDQSCYKGLAHSPTIHTADWPFDCALIGFYLRPVYYYYDELGRLSRKEIGDGPDNIGATLPASTATVPPA